MAKGMMKMKNKIKAIAAACALAVSLIGTIPVQAAPTYSVEFRAGSKGTINGSAKVTEKVGYGDEVNVPSNDVIHPKAGYWFTGWSPEVETTVTEKAVYVAQYARLIDAVEYRINYVDTTGVSLATQQIAQADKGVSFTVYAPAIEGYAPDATSKRVTITEEGTEVNFVYTSTLEPNVETNVVTETVTETVTENVVQTVPGGTTGTTENQTPPTAPETEPQTQPQTEPGNQTDVNQPNEGETTIPDEQVPLDNTQIGDQNNEGNQNDNDDRETSSISDEEVPKANKDLSSTPGWVYGVLGGAIVALGAIGAGIVVLKRKRW